MSVTSQTHGNVPLAILAVGLVVWIAFHVGRLLIPPLNGRGRQASSRLLAIAVGLNCLSWMAIVWGTSGFGRLMQPIWLMGCLALMVFYWSWAARSRRNKTNGHDVACCGVFYRPTVQQIGIGLLVLITLGPALCPPTGWDELVYHHELPRRWLLAGWPEFYADLPYSAFPSLGEILFWVAGPLESIVAPRLISWVCWLLGLALFYGLLRRVVQPTLAISLLVALAASGTFLMISANCYVESLQLMNVSALLLTLQRVSRRADWKSAVALGVLSGGCVATKLTGAPILVLPLVCFLYRFGRGRLPLRRLGSYLGIYACAALVMALPFYLRPWLLTGNPFYPYYCEWFSADVAQLEMSQFHHALGSAFGIPDWIGFVFGPILLAWDRQLYDGDFGWQYLILLLLAVLAVVRSFSASRQLQEPSSHKRGRNRQSHFRKQSHIGKQSIARYAAVANFCWPAIAGLYLFWFCTAQQARFLIPAVLVLAIAAAYGLRRLQSPWQSRIALVLLVATAISAPWRVAGHYLGSWMCAVRLITPVAYIDESTDHKYWPLIAAIGEHTQPDASLLLLFEHEGFYIPRRHQIGTPFFQEQLFTPSEDFSTADSILAALSQGQFTHLVVATKPAGPDVPAAWIDRSTPFLAALNLCIQHGNITPLWQSERHVLYRIEPPRPQETTPPKS